MAVTQHSRHQLFKRLEKVLGMEDAGTLLDLLPPVGWGDLATKQDLDHLRVATKRDIDELRVATKQDLDHLRVATKRDLDHLRVATKRDIDELRVATKGDMELLRSEVKGDLKELKSDLKDELTSKLRGLFFAIAALFLTAVGLLIAASRLI